MLGLRRVEQCCTKLVPPRFNINKILEISLLQKSSHYPSPVIISDANFQTLKSSTNRYKMKYCLCVYSMATCKESSYQAMFSKENKLECPLLLALTGCKGRTRKYKPKGFHTARACEGCLENQGLVFPGTARAPS